MELVSETNTLNITEYVGDTVRVSLLYTDDLGEVLDLSNVHVIVAVRDKLKHTVLTLDSNIAGANINEILYDINGVALTDVNGVPLTSTESSSNVKEILLNNSINENISFMISSAQTAILGAGSWTWSLVIRDSNNFVNTLVVGKFKLKER